MSDQVSEAICPRCGEIVRGVAADEQLLQERDRAQARLDAATEALREIADWKMVTRSHGDYRDTFYVIRDIARDAHAAVTKEETG